MWLKDHDDLINEVEVQWNIESIKNWNFLLEKY
jgi:hypothetical protein